MDWKPTGRTRNRCIRFGLPAYEVEDTRMVNTWMPGAPHNPMNWRPVYPVVTEQARRGDRLAGHGAGQADRGAPRKAGR